MNSKLENVSNNSSAVEATKETDAFNPLDHNVNIQQELWIQRQVSNQLLTLIFYRYLICKYNLFSNMKFKY